MSHSGSGEIARARRCTEEYQWAVSSGPLGANRPVYIGLGSTYCLMSTVYVLPTLYLVPSSAAADIVPDTIDSLAPIIPYYRMY